MIRVWCHFCQTLFVGEKKKKKKAKYTLLKASSTRMFVPLSAVQWLQYTIHEGGGIGSHGEAEPLDSGIRIPTKPRGGDA